MNELKVFSFGSNEVRTLAIDGEPWWVAKDVAEVLGYQWDTHLVDKIPVEWKGAKPIRTPGGEQAMTIISEQGLYFFLSRSDKPNALPFQKWISGEVIPSIRKTGQYGKQLSLEEMTKLVISGMDERIKALENKVTEDAPKVESFNLFMSSDTLYNIAHVAKHIGVGEIKFFKMLREDHILQHTKPSWNIPYQYYIDKGYFEVKTIPVKMGESVKNILQTYVTSKGVQFLISSYTKKNLSLVS